MRAFKLVKTMRKCASSFKAAKHVQLVSQLHWCPVFRSHGYSACHSEKLHGRQGH